MRSSVRRSEAGENPWRTGSVRLPYIDPICSTETDDLSAWLSLDEMVNFAVGDQIFVRRVLWEVREFELLVRSAPCWSAMYLKAVEQH